MRLLITDCSEFLRVVKSKALTPNEEELMKAMHLRLFWLKNAQEKIELFHVGIQNARVTTEVHTLYDDVEEAQFLQQRILKNLTELSTYMSVVPLVFEDISKVEELFE